MSKIYYLKLTGADSYGSRAIGSVTRGQSIGLTSAALAEKLLGKGTRNEDGTLNPFFTQVTYEEATGKAAGGSGAKRSRLNDSLAQVAPAAPAEDSSDEVVAQEEEQGTESEEKQEVEEGQTKVTRGRGRKASA